MIRGNIPKLCFLATLWSLVWMLPAFGQDEIEEVVVTGSYIARPVDSSQPITVLSYEDLANEQRNSVGEIFKDMSVTNGSMVMGNIENSSSPTASINLRGVGPRATLVMLNGRRQTVDGSIGTEGNVAVDVNNITPAIMIDRVEILTDGASALYGSDAVAGVVNFITRRDFEGAEVHFRGLNTDRSGTDEYTVGAIFGSQGRDTSIVAAFEYTSRERLKVDDLFSDDRLLTGLVSSSGNPGSLRPVAGGPRIADPLCGSPLLSDSPRAGLLRGSPRAPFCAKVIAYGNNILAETERFVGLATIDHDFGNGLRSEVEIGFAQARLQLDAAFGLPILGGPVVPSTNPGIIAEHARSRLPIADYRLQYSARSPIEPEPVENRSQQDTYRVAASLEGDFTDSWSWNATATWSENDTIQVRRDTIAERFRMALNCEGLPTRDACWNPMANNFLASPGDAHYNDSAVFEWFFGNPTADGTATLTTLDFVATGDLGDIVALALGAQVRNQSFQIDWDDLSNDGAFAFVASRPQLDFSGDRDADGLFAELALFPLDTLEIQFAARYEDYGEVNTTDPKVGILWTPTESLFVRATAGSSFRVPGELQILGATIGRGPATELHGESVVARAITTGNASLKPEEADNFTAGFTWDATDNFTMDINYWSIDFKNLVVADDVNLVFDNDLADGTIDDPRIVISPAAGTNVVADLLSQDIARIELSYINQDFIDTDGIDLNFDYGFDAGGNNFGVGLQGTYTLTYDVSTESGVADGVGLHNETNAGVPTPAWMGNLRFDWARGNHSARATFRYISGVKEDNVRGIGITEESSHTTVDLLYNLLLGGGRGAFTAGVINVADKEPPRKAFTLLTSETILHDPRGRLYRVGLNWGF